MTVKFVTKRNGELEAFDINKVLQWELWACVDVKEHIDWKDILLKANDQFREKMSTQEIQLKLIEECNNRKTHAHSLVAGRLYAAYIAKKIHGNPYPTVAELHESLIAKGYMAENTYTPEEYAQVESIINHKKNLQLTYIQVKQLVGKYSLTDRTKGVQFETPQFVFMRMAMALSEIEDNRMVHVQKFYEYLSDFKISAPTPNYVNLGTTHNGYISCCLYTTDDSAASLAIGDHIAYTMTYMSAGIGGFLNTRSINDKVKGGVIKHMGKLPYLRATAAAVNANLQSGRGGAATQYFSVYDPEALDLIYLQNPRTPIAKQNRDIHFAMQFNDTFVEKVFKNEDVFAFNKYTAPKLMDAMFSGDKAAFRQEYERLEQDPTFAKKTTSAKELAINAIKQSHEVATLYHINTDEVNRHTPFKDPIYSSNLCVSGDTKILTKEHGYVYIDTLWDKEVHVWNGKTWSLTVVQKTGENQKLLTVSIDSGAKLDVTAYHKWYVKSTETGQIVEKRTWELAQGDELIGFDLDRRNHLGEHFTTHLARLKVLVNVLEHHGSITYDRMDKLLLVTNVDRSLINLLRLKLQEVGVTSHFKEKPAKTKYTQDPAHLYTLVVDGAIEDLLYKAGLSVLSLDISGLKKDKLVNKVVSVLDNGLTGNTYCVNEPLRNMVMFEGVLTGNCLEIVQPTKPYVSMIDLYSSEKHERGEISLCALAGIVPSNVSDAEYEDVAYYSLLMIDKCIHKNTYIFPHLEYTAKSRMNAGVGIIGLAYDLAKRGLKYTSKEGLHHIHKVAERHMYSLIKASVRLGKEKGNAAWMHKTKWPEGWLPIDTYKKTVDTGMDFKNLCDWETLRAEVIANGGMRNSCLVSYQPTESSSKATGLPNGIYPIRAIYLKKTDGNSAVDAVATESDTLANQYELAWDIPVDKLFQVYGVVQKFTDQAISADIYSDRTDNPEIKASKLLDELYYMYKFGVKTRYYTNSKTTKSLGLDDVVDEKGCESGVCTL